MRPQRERVDGSAAIAAGRRRMGFVHHDEVPANRLEGMQCFRTFHEVDRRQVDARQRPWIDVSRQVPRRPPQPRRVGIHDGEIEQCVELLHPLAADGSG